MLKFPLGPDDTFLILTPRWADLGPAWQNGLLALLFVLPLALIVWLYRYELRLISLPSACGLLALRLAMLLLIWLAVGLQPHLADFHVEEMPGRVRVAVDLSSSMDVADLQRTPEEWTALAQALKLHSDEQAISRKAIMARILFADGLNLLGRLAERHQVEIVGFHQRALEMAPEQLFKELSAENAGQGIFPTDLLQPLARVSSSRDNPLLGIVLISDGQHNVGAPPFQRADDLGKQGIPIFPVVIGSRQLPRDLMILDVQAPTKAFKNATVPIEIRCKVTNLPPQELTVEMQFDGKPVAPEHRALIAHKGKDEVHTVRFQATLDEAGTHALTIKAASKTGKEITLANNSVTRIIRVADDRAKVLLVDGDARWEYHYLAMALGRDPAIALERVVFSQPRIGMIKDDQRDKAGLPKLKLPEVKAERKEVDPLLEFDCIILGDVAPEDLPGADRKRLERFVSERGGTLILSAGKRYLPLAYSGADDPLVKMLPITQPRELKPEAGFTLRVTGEGKQRPFLNLEPEQPTFAWPELPKHYWGIVGTRKPAASVLLVPVIDETAPAKEDSDTGILVQQNYGFGRVLFVGIDSTWRWRYRVGDTYHHRFWGQLARWSAADKLLPAGNRFIRYGPREPAYSEGQEVELAVRLGENLPRFDGAADARANLYRKKADGTEEKVAVVPLSANSRQPNLLEAKVGDLPAGVYRMELDMPKHRAQLAEPNDDKDAPAKGRDLFRIWPREHGELLDLSTNWSVMQGLAERSGGRLFTAQNVEELLDRLERRVERTESRDESKPWQDEPLVWWMLGVLLGLLTLEWGWRKWLDLP